jgi:hypothetical protein
MGIVEDPLGAPESWEHVADPMSASALAPSDGAGPRQIDL